VQKNKVQVRIAGKEYSLVGVESDEYIQKVGLYIDKKMNEVMKNNNKLSTSLAAVLTAINVADDYFKVYESEANLKKQLSEALDELKILREEKKRLSDENEELSKKVTELRLELAKREAELREVRNSLEKFTGQRK